MFKFNLDRVNTDLPLAQGVSGGVYAYQKNHNDPQDNKWVVKNIVTKTVEEFINHIQEIVLGFSCENSNVLSAKGYHLRFDKVTRDWNIYIKLPRMAKSLSKVIQDYRKDKKIIPENKIVKYFYAITQGLKYLHERGIAHRDIKPDNVLLDEDEKNIKIADFGLGMYSAGHTSDSPAKQAGAYFYAAPENLDKSKLLMKKEVFKTDLWSLGMVMFELCTLLDLRNLDFSGMGAKKEKQLKFYIEGLEGKYSKPLLELILKLLCYEPNQRIDLSEVTKILEENYPRYLANRNLGPSNKTRIEELEEELKKKDREIEEMTKQYKCIINKYQEGLRKRKKEVEQLLETKKERLF